MSTVTSTPSKRSRKAAAGALAVALLFPLVSTTPASAADSPWMNTSLGADQRAALLLAEMTLAEKVDLMTGNQGQEPYGFFNAGIPRLGIPALRMQDAGAGISPRGWSLPGTGQHATAMPSGIALGATWDPEVVPGYATVVGNEAKNTGGNVLLGPNADLIRQPWWGRINETESEDPFLTAALVKPFITAVQDNDLMATIKHPIAYNQELFRSAGQNAVISERALAEVHNLPFKAASEANVASAMCSFNKINGVFSCENDFVLNELLRQQGGFPGFVMTDFGAMHSTIPALKAGTDMETGTANFYGAKLVQAVNNGEVDVALVNRSVIRILTPMFEFGLFDTDYTPSPINVQAGSTEALKVQNQAITLLKNGGSVLPLTSSTQSIAVIGADANIIASPGGAPYVSATQPVPALDGIRARADKAGVTMTYSPGNDPVNGTSLLERADMTAVPSTVLAPASGGGSGLTAEYFANDSFSGAPAITRVDRQVNYDTGFLGGTGVLASIYASQVQKTAAVTPGAFDQSVRYTGTITAPLTGTYKFNLTGWGDATLQLDGTTVVDMTGTNGLRDVSSANLDLVGGQEYALQVDYVANRQQQRLEPGTLLLQWSTPDGAFSPAIQAAAAAAADASVAVVYVRTFEGEIRDRVSLKLPQSADQLITAVRAANPRTVVVLATAGAVTMPWLSQVPGVLQSYFGGQEEGSAIASALFGDINPSGHLPITYPKSETAVPYGLKTPWAYSDPNIPHTEGINIGYRGYAAQNIKPLFPFGHGLSYTSFKYSDVKVKSAKGDKQTEIRFRLTNTGRVGGAEVTQLYLGVLPTAVETPVKQLAGFHKVFLKPGKSEWVTISVPSQSLSYYDTASKKFITPEGKVSFFIGSSADDKRLSGSFTVKGGTEPGACSDTRATVIIGGFDSKVANAKLSDGCTINDRIDEAGDYKNHGLFIKHVGDIVKTLVSDGVISDKDGAAIKRAAARSGVGNN